MTDGRTHTAGRPDQAMLDELEDLLGRDVLRIQFARLSEQLQAFVVAAPAMTSDRLAQEAHNVAGAADVLGLQAMGARLRACQQAAADGDIAAARAAIGAVVPMQRGFDAFLAGY